MKYILENLSLRSGKKVDGIIFNKSILIENGLIKDIFESSETGKYLDVERIDCTNLYATPGLINMHVHLFGSGKPSKNLGKSKMQDFLMFIVKKTPLGKPITNLLVKKACKRELEGGTTTCRTVGDFVYSDVRIRNKINAGKTLGPRLIVSGPAITSATGHGAGTFAYASDDIEKLKYWVNLNKSRGVDFIKICTTGGVMDATKKGEPGVVRMTLEQIKAICDEAHSLGLIVASHTESEEGVRLNALAGVDSIEHGADFNEETKNLLCNNGSFICTTFTPAISLSKIDPKFTKLNELSKFNTDVVLGGIIKCAKKAIKNNIPIALGTDASCPFCFHNLTHREMKYASMLLGIDGEEALEIMTAGNAKLAKIDNITGSIEVGKSADIVITKQDPVFDNDTYNKIEYVIANGRLIKRPREKKFKKYFGMISKYIG